MADPISGGNLTINSLTAKSVLAGTKNSRLEGFLLAKYKHTNIPTMTSKRFIRINKIKEKIIYFFSLCANYNNRLPVVGNDSQNNIHCCRWAIIYTN